MSLRTHAVVVQPDQWTGAPAELARLLVPIVGVDATQLAEALGRGPMTVEADLSPDAARALVNRLSSLGVPARIDPPADDRPAVPGGIQTDKSRVTDEVPRTRAKTMMGMKPMAPDEAADGWGALFPDLKPHEPKPAPAAPSLDDLEDAPPTVAATAQPERTPPLGSLSTRDPASLWSDVAVETPDALEGAEPLPVEAPPKPQEPARPIRPSGFDPKQLSALMPADSEARPPYAPNAFDPRPEHHPPFAVLFAVLAPGGGHVFNGDDDDGLAIGLRFWMIAPWFRSVAEARAQAEKIRTHWAPRPEDGNGFRAIRYVAAWWFSVAMIGALLSFGVPLLLKALNRTPDAPEGPTAEAIAASFESAGTRVLGARVKALDALAAASKDIVPSPQYTLDDKERSERLYSLGYAECSRRSYAMCEQMMKRVLELKPAFGSAIKLQAWASLAQRGRRDEPMPDVGPVLTLNELELQKMREEMVLQGERVPPPPNATGAGTPQTPEDPTAFEQPGREKDP